RIAATRTAVDAGLHAPAILTRSPTLVEADSLAYLTLHRVDPDGVISRWELGAAGYGPAGLDLANRICETTRTWNHDPTVHPVVTAYPAGALDEGTDRRSIRKPRTRLVIAF